MQATRLPAPQLLAPLIFWTAGGPAGAEGVTVIDIVAGGEFTVPSLTLNVKLSEPLKPVVGV